LANDVNASQLLVAVKLPLADSLALQPNAVRTSTKAAAVTG
jgi:hypothetical protein